MKQIRRFTLALAIFITGLSFAQQGINYKAVIKDGSGTILANQTITVQFQILQGTGMTIVYQERHIPTTDANGLIILNIGEGTIAVMGVFANIDWGSDSYFLNTQVDTGAGPVDLGTTGFKTVPYAFQSKTAIELPGGIDQAYIEDLETRIAALESSPPVPGIGDYLHGGVVFWIDPTDNSHGLVCAIQDQSSGIQWYNGTALVTSATGIIIGTGSINTDAIIAAQGTLETNYAAGLARAYPAGGYYDWFLPSKDELYLMYMNRAAINATSISNGGDAFSSGLYWSSTEFDIGEAWEQFLYSGEQYHINKGNQNYIRAVRAF